MKYDYKIIRSDRKTLSVTIRADNSITVRAPLNTSVNKIESFLQSKSAWLDKKIINNNRILAVNSSVKSFETLLVGGKNLPLITGGKNGIIDGAVCVKDLSCIKSVLCGNYGNEFLERFNLISRSYGFKVNSVKFRSYKARWGCCDSDGNIVFNYKILMLPADLQDYIIVHELCHTKFMNHSACFWEEVKRCRPDYQSERKRLKEYAFLTRLYP